MSPTRGVHGIWVVSGERSNPLVCKRMAAWRELSDGLMAGAVGGLRNGKPPVVFPFLARLDRGEVTLLWSDGRDRLTNEVIHLTEFGRDARLGTAAGYAEVWEWNDRNVWGSGRGLWLLEARRPKLTWLEGDVWGVGTRGVPEWLSTVYLRVLGNTNKKAEDKVSSIRSVGTRESDAPRSRPRT